MSESAYLQIWCGAVKNVGPSKMWGFNKCGVLKNAGPFKMQGLKKRWGPKNAGSFKMQGLLKCRILKKMGS